MIIRYWPQFQFEDQDKVSTTGPDDDFGSWLSVVGRAGILAALASTASIAGMAQAAGLMQPFMDDVPAIAPAPVTDEISTPRRINVVFGNKVATFIGSQDWAVPVIRAEDNDPGQPEVTPEPTTFIIGPGNWAAGVDEAPRPAREEDYWENQVAPLQWEIRQEKPWFLPDDPVAPKVPSDDTEQLPEIGPYADPLVYIIGPGNWACGSDEMPTFSTASRDEDYWIDPNTMTTPLGEIAPVRAYMFQQDDPRFFGKVVDEELWRNPKELLDYWNRWPRPDFQQNDPSGLFVPPDLSCVVEPVIGGIVGIGATFSTVTGLIVPFTDTCGNPL